MTLTNSKGFSKVVTPSIHLFDLYTLIVFPYGIRLVGKPSIAYRLNQEEATNTFSMPPGGSIHVARVKTLEVHTMISTRIDVDTRRKGPIQHCVLGLCFVFPAETPKQNTLIPKVRRRNLNRFRGIGNSCPAMSCPRRDHLKYTNDVLQNLLPSFVPLH